MGTGWGGSVVDSHCVVGRVNQAMTQSPKGFEGICIAIFDKSIPVNQAMTQLPKGFEGICIAIFDKSIPVQWGVWCSKGVCSQVWTHTHTHTHTCGKTRAHADMHTPRMFLPVDGGLGPKHPPALQHLRGAGDRRAGKHPSSAVIT